MILRVRLLDDRINPFSFLASLQFAMHTDLYVIVSPGTTATPGQDRRRVDEVVYHNACNHPKNKF